MTSTLHLTQAHGQHFQILFDLQQVNGENWACDGRTSALGDEPK